MAIVSFDEMEYQSEKAVISEAKVEGNVVTIWFKLVDGATIRENYRMTFQKERLTIKSQVSK